MKIKEIILEGFKSYGNRTVLDKLDPEFTSITGLNGSGKSNILDAICFILGLQSLGLVDLLYFRQEHPRYRISYTKEAKQESKRHQ
jgi:chromosome segregation ATPase